MAFGVVSRSVSSSAGQLRRGWESVAAFSPIHIVNGWAICGSASAPAHQGG